MAINNIGSPKVRMLIGMVTTPNKPAIPITPRALKMFEDAFQILQRLDLSKEPITETIQLFIPSRSFNYLDLLFNIAGIPIGAFIINQLHKMRPVSTT